MILFFRKCPSIVAILSLGPKMPTTTLIKFLTIHFVALAIKLVQGLNVAPMTTMIARSWIKVKFGRKEVMFIRRHLKQKANS